MLGWFHQNCLCCWMSTQSHVLTVPIAAKNKQCFIECRRMFGLCPVSICVFLLSSCPPFQPLTRSHLHPCATDKGTSWLNVPSQAVIHRSGKPNPCNVHLFGWNQNWKSFKIRKNQNQPCKLIRYYEKHKNPTNALLWFAPCSKFSTCPTGLSHTWPHRKAQSERPHDSERSPLEALGHCTKENLYI